MRDSRRFLFILISICCFSLCVWVCIKFNIEYLDDLIRFHMIITSCYILQQSVRCLIEIMICVSAPSSCYYHFRCTEWQQHTYEIWMERTLLFLQWFNTLSCRHNGIHSYIEWVAHSFSAFCQCALYLFYYNQIICLAIQNKYGQGINVCACTRNKNPNTNTHIENIRMRKCVSFCRCQFELFAWKKERQKNV